ncbi:MAG: SMI1/KNR4 family protein [Peptococcaceae bacterium]|nr:SMI1/KNR4 family protein [Peptococcaceae bacterium]
MKDILDRLKKLSAISAYVQLYEDFDNSVVLKHMGKITGEIDRPYIDFLMLTNGASVLDYCFFGFKNKNLGGNLYDNVTDLWRDDNLLTFRFWSCIGDSIGNSFGYLDKKNTSGGHYFGYHSLYSPGKVYLVSSSFSVFMEKFLSQIELAVAKNKNAIGLEGNDWFMDRARLIEHDKEMEAFLQDTKGTEYSLIEGCL